MSFAQVNGATIYYELHGTGKPLILISGYTCDHSVWEPILEQLTRHYSILIFDNRGIGQTKDNGSELSAELLARDVIALADHLGFDQPHIIGQSMGGNIALTVAHLLQERMGKLGILTSSAKWRPAMLMNTQVRIEMRERNFDFNFIMDATLPWIYGNDFLSDHNKIDQWKQLARENPYPQSLADQKRQFHILKTFDGRTYLNNINVSTLVAYGKQDILTLPNESQFIAQKIKLSELVDFDCAHAIMQEASKNLSDTLLRFLG